ncbi:MAG TPA: metal ABC transporter substrate-binding protein [Natronosporangium sp.]|nr:metal ABC transporter substrate-binding protein [Natronosporangium sp.]
MLRRVRTRLGAVAAATAAVLAAAACGDAPAPPGDRLRIVAGFYPLEYVAERVGGDRVTVTGLAPTGGHAHDRELTVRQAALISDADLVIHLSGFQPSVDAAVRAYARDVLDVARAVPLRTAAAHGRPDHGPAGAGQEPTGHDGAGTDHGAETDRGAETDHGVDPHVWLDPHRLAAVTSRVADALARLDPAHATGYAARAGALRADLAELDTAYTDGLARCERREMVVAHAAFGYVADRYGLHQIAVAGLEPDGEPTPGRVIEVVELARAHGATTVFAEARASPDIARLIAGELGARTATLDPIEARAPGSDADYLSLMRANLAALTEGLGCA